MSALDNLGMPAWAIEEAEKAANAIFDGTLELIKWSIERRRQLACWRAVKLAEMMTLINRRRASEGKRPRRFPLKRWRLDKARSECKANRREHPELAIVCQAVDHRVAMLDHEQRRTTEIT